MIIWVEHSTVYEYDNSVVLDTHTFRLRPRMDSHQRLTQFDLQISPVPAGTAECLDQDGNLALQAWFASPTQELRVRSMFRVELLRENPFDFMSSGLASWLSLAYEEPLATALAHYRDVHSVTESVQAFARSAAANAHWDLPLFLNELNFKIFHNFQPLTRLDGDPWPSELTLRLQQGSCRDLAVLFCDSCRVMGVAARFVSGYECATAGRDDASMHAWAEVYLPGVGWRGFDPSRGVAVSNGHVAVAAAFDSRLAAPISGTYSGAGSRMGTSLRMSAETGCWV